MSKNEVLNEVKPIVNDIKSLINYDITIKGFEEINEYGYEDIDSLLTDSVPLSYEVISIDIYEGFLDIFVINALGSCQDSKFNYILRVYFDTKENIYKIEVLDVINYKHKKELHVCDILSIFDIISTIESIGVKEYIINNIENYFK